MTLNEAYNFLRRWQDWMCGYDARGQSRNEVHLEVLRVAVDKILSSQGLSQPLITCEKCRHYNREMNNYIDCNIDVRGECHSFEPEK